MEIQRRSKCLQLSGILQPEALCGKSYSSITTSLFQRKVHQDKYDTKVTYNLASIVMQIKCI